MRTTVQTRPTNSIVQSARQQPEQSSFETAVLGSTLQNMIEKSVPDERARSRFTSNIISIVSQSPQLQQCRPASIVASALRGEGMGLIINHGFYVVPYRDAATFLLSYKGMISLAMATNLYADLDCLEVREGEFRGRDRRTGKESVDFSIYETDEEREQHPVVGYYAYFELKDGMFRGEYWNMDKILKHASQYSPAFNIETYKKLVNGELTADEARRVKSGSPWYDIGSGFERMCKKTVLRSLLNSGYAPLTNEVKTALAMDSSDISIPVGATNSRGNRNSLMAAAKPVVDADGVIVVDAETGNRTASTAVSSIKPEEAPSGNSESKQTARTSATGQMRQGTIFDTEV